MTNKTRAAAYIASLAQADGRVSLSDLKTLGEYMEFAIGTVVLVVLALPVVIIVGLSVVWEGFDRGFAGGLVRSGQERSGFLLARVVPWIGRTTESFNRRFVKKPEDTFVVNCAVAFGVLVPAGFAFCVWHYMHFGFHLGIFLLYHVCRLGPLFQNFAFVYTLCHKEGHATRTGIWREPYNIVLKYVFNWWVGLFYGVLPSTFAYGHSVNHHRYNNGPHDVISTADKPRDNWICFLCYLPRQLVYAANISTIVQFAKEGNLTVTMSMIWGSMWYFAWAALWWMWSPTFALAYIVYPFFENAIMLGGVNWSWHSFLDPLDPENEYVYSLTILDGAVNVLNEDYHVTHHQYPGQHWTSYPGFLKKHWDTYCDKQASVFKGTNAGEILIMLLLRDYDALADRFQDLKGQRDGKLMTKAEKIELLKTRVRGCWWGPRAPGDLLQLSGRELGNLDDRIPNGPQKH